MITRWNAIALAVLLTACGGGSNAQVCDPATNKCRPADGWDGLPPNDRFQHLEPTQTVEGLGIEATPSGAAGWRLVIRNNTDEPVTFSIEDSSFTLSGNKGASRVIRRDTPRLEAHKPQAPAQIAPHDSWIGILLVTQLLRAEDAEAKGLEYQEKIQADPDASWQKQKGAELEDLITKERALVAEAVIHGTLTLAFQRSGGPATWSATVVGMQPH
jgi:hypothetical protein